MRIGLNLLYLIPGIVGGTETYAKGLLSGLKTIDSDYEFFLFLNRESEHLIVDDHPGFTKVVCPVDAKNRKNRYFFEQFGLRKYLKRNRIDLLHSLAYSSPLFPGCPMVVTIPDLNFKAFGSTMPLIRRLVLRFIVRQAVRCSKKVITISEFSRREIIGQYPVTPEKVIVSHLAAEIADVKSENNSVAKITTQGPAFQQPYAVAFSSVTANKNLLRLIEAFLEAKHSRQFKQNLVLIGHKHPEAEKLRTRDKTQSIHWTGYLKKDDVVKVMKHADFLVFSSYYEGFGLPVLEAMANGVPVICSNAAALPEVAGDAVLYFDPFSVREMAAKISLIAMNRALREELREKGYKNYSRFSWRKTAATTLTVYDTVLNRTHASVMTHL